MNLKETRFGDWSCGSFHCFLILYCVLTSIQRLPGSFMGSLLQSIERQFQISSRLSGTMISAGDIANISVVVILAYFGSRGNRAKWMGAGALMIAFACFLISTPGYMISQKDGLDEQTVRKGYNISSSNGLSNGSISSVLMADAKLPFAYCSNETNYLKTSLNKAKCERQNADIGNAAAYYVVLTGIVIMGMAKSMPHTLGVPLIDDGVKNKRNFPLYFAAIQCLRIFGPIFGMILTAIAGGLYVNFKPPPGMTPYDARWISAWWLGFVIVSVLLIGPAILMMFYPNVDTMLKERQEAQKKKKQQLANEEGEKEQNVDSRTPIQEKNGDAALLEKSHEGKVGSGLRKLSQSHVAAAVMNVSAFAQLVGFLAAILEILRSPIYTGRLVGRIFDAFAWKGMHAFRSKYLENHFGIPMFKANIWIGLLGIGSYMTGTLAGSFVMRKFNIDGRRAAAYCAFCSIVATLLTFGQSFLSCHAVVNQVGRDGAVHNYTYPACVGCDCSSAPLYPVCSVDGTPYYSPCHAGCKDYNRSLFDVLNPQSGSGKRNHFEFHSCGCVNGTNTGGDQRVSRDWCQDDCFNPMILYFLLSAIGSIIAGTQNIPGLLIHLRSVPKEHRSVAIGFGSLVVGLVSVLPSTPVYGMMIDAACLVWNTACGQKGACLIYNPNQLRRSILTTYVILHAVGDCADIFVWYKAKNLKLMGEHDEKEPKKKPPAIIAAE